MSNYRVKRKRSPTEWKYSVVTYPDAVTYEWLYLNCNDSWFATAVDWPFPTNRRRITFKEAEDMTVFKLRFPTQNE